jgi:hypothetical protein
MDNLIRTANGMPIIQLDYTQASGMVTITNTIGGSDNQAATATNLLMLPAATLSATRTIVTTLMGNLANVNANQVSIGATPNITNNEIYDAYLEFLTQPGSLMASCDKPPENAVHIMRKYNHKYYWVPTEYRGPFFKLALLTTAQRGKALLAPDEFFKVSLVKMEANVPSNLFPGVRNLTFRLDKPIPADVGYLVLDSSIDKTQYPLQSIPGMTLSRTSLFSIPVDVAKVPQFSNVPLSASIYLQHQRPKLPTTDDLINRVNFQLQQIQFNQLRGLSP